MSNGRTASGRRTRIDFASNVAIRAVIGAALMVPYRWRVPLAGAIFARVIAPLAGYGTRVRDNLSHVMPELPKAEVDRLIGEVCNNTGRTLIEIYSGKEFTRRFENAPLTGPGVEALQEAHEAGRPVVLVSGHFGNYDAPRAALLANGYQVGGLYREMNNGYFNDHYVKAISTIGQPVFPRGRRGLPKMVRFLRAGNMVGLLIDQYMRDGADLTFFGKRAPTALSAVELALKCNALVVPVYGIRQPNGLDFEVRCEAPVPHSDAHGMTQALNDSLEALVRQHMGQWLWHWNWHWSWDALAIAPSWLQQSSRARHAGRSQP